MANEDRSTRAPRKHTTVRRVDHYLGPDKEIRPEDLDKYEAEGGWMIQPKVDGMWCCLTVGSPEQGRPNILKSRDARTPEITGSNAGDLREAVLPFLEGTVLVGELEAASQWAKEQVDRNGYRRMFLFDVVRIGEDQDLRDRTTADRYEVLKDFNQMLWLTPGLSKRFPMVPYYTSDFRKNYDRWIQMGFEGVVIKRLDSLYRTSRLDGKTDLWLRCKKHVTGDYVLMGVGTTPGGKTKAPGPIGLWGYIHPRGVEASHARALRPEVLRSEVLRQRRRVHGLGEIQVWISTPCSVRSLA